MPITRILDNGAILQLQDEDTRGLIVTDLEKGSGIIIEKDTEFVYITYPTTATKQTIDPDLVIDPINTGVDNLFDQIQDYVNNVPTGGMGFTYLAQNFTNLDTVVAPQPITAGELAYVFNSQGTAWLPGSIGGSYYPTGIYVSNGSAWISDRNAIAEQLQISIDDINSKLESGDNVSELNNDAGYLTAGGNNLISSNDTNADFLENKIDSSTSDGVGIIRTIQNQGANEKIQFRLGDHYLSLASTCLYTGAVLSVGATTGTFNITSGEGFFVDSNSNFSNTKNNVQPVIITARTNISVTNIATFPVTYVMIDKNDTIIQSTTYPTPEQRRDNIFIGVVVHSDNVNVNTVDNLQVTGNDIVAQLGDVMEGLGFFKLKGNLIKANGTNLSFNKTFGTVFKRGGNYINNKKDPHTITNVDQSPVTFRYRSQNSVEGLDTIAIDPTTYDNNGTITTIPQANDATIQRVYMFPEGQIRVQRGQEIFNTISQAIDRVGSEQFVVESNIDENAILLASIVVRKDCTDLSNENRCKIYISSRFGELGSVGSAATTTLQQAFNNSLEPEISVPSGNALSIKAATDGAEIIQDWRDENNNVTSTITGDGDWVGSTFNGRDISSDGAKLDGIETGAEVNPILNKSLTLETPTASDDITFFRTDVAITVQEVRAVSTGTSPSTTYQLKHATDRNTSLGNNLTTSSTTTSRTTGNVATLDDATIPSNSWVWLETTAASGTDVILSIDLIYTED